MKNVNLTYVILLFILLGCKNETLSESGGMITIDVTKEKYLHKELILQDFMNVEYIALETSDTFVCKGNILAVGKKNIVARNNVQDGDIFIFNRKTGNGIRKFNHRGSGNKEYAIAYQIVLDEDNEELFIYDIMQNKIMVYDLYGNYKRHFSRDDKARINHVYNFDKDCLICSIGDDNAKFNKSTFIIMSKQNGEVFSETSISYEEKKTMRIADDNNLLMLYPYPSILSFENDWIFSEVSSDTVFKFSSKNSNKDPIIAKKPTIQTLNPETFLFPEFFTNRYYFMGKVKKEKSFSTTKLIYDKKEKDIYEYTLYNGDYSNTQKINTADIEVLNGEIIFCQKLEAYKLVEAYNNGELKGALKDIASELTEESNPVIMLAKDKQ